jgi:transcriptional regulator with XRE-family HTH domain
MIARLERGDQDRVPTLATINKVLAALGYEADLVIKKWLSHQHYFLYLACSNIPTEIKPTKYQKQKYQVTTIEVLVDFLPTALKSTHFILRVGTKHLFHLLWAELPVSLNL